MIRGLRRTRPCSSLSLAALFLVVWVPLTSLIHNDNDDVICQPELVVHNHAAHRIVGSSDSTRHAPEHCFICHWHSLRIVSNAVRVDTPSITKRAVADVVAAWLSLAGRTQLASRAPPLA